MGRLLLCAALALGVFASGCDDKDATNARPTATAPTPSQTAVPPAPSPADASPPPSDAAVAKAPPRDATIPGTLGLTLTEFTTRWNDAVQVREAMWAKLKLGAAVPGPVPDTFIYAFPNTTELVLATNADDSVRWAKILSNDDSLYEADDSSFNTRFLAWKLLLNTVKPDMSGAIQKDLAEQVLGVAKGKLMPNRAATGASTRYGFKFERGSEGARKRIWVKDAKDLT